MSCGPCALHLRITTATTKRAFDAWTMAFAEDSTGIEATIAGVEAALRLITRLRDALLRSVAAEGMR